jgi:hypothetical protein
MRILAWFVNPADVRSQEAPLLADFGHGVTSGIIAAFMAAFLSPAL